MTELYVHIPYCKRKCEYCNFYSLPATRCDDAYVVALLQEARTYPKEKINTLYFGGGTPSLLSKKQFSTLFCGLKEVFDVSGEEISMECNPDTADKDKLEYFRSLGVNRLSVGVQSLNDVTLKAIGRIHNAETALNALYTATKIFDSVNADYMVGLPFQTIDDVKNDLERIIATGVKHVSVYSLILEEDAGLYKKVKCGELRLPDVDEQVDFYDKAREVLSENGFSRYEISNFAKKGFECKHNTAVWRFNDYIGLGPAAHSFYKGKRYFNEKDILSYLKGDNIRKYAEETTESLKAEFIMLALRTARGLYFKEYFEKFDTDFLLEFALELKKPEVEKTCLIDNDKIVIKDEFFYVSNSIIENLVEKYI